MPEDIEKTPLSTDARNSLSASSFVFPQDRRYPIHDLSHAKNALARSSGKPEEATVRAAVYKKYPQLKKSIDANPVEIDTDIWKNDSEHIVYGVVLEPDLEDSQGDIISAEEIQKAAHNYLRESRKQDVQHSEQPALVEPIESYVAPHDMILHGKLVKKGAWVLACKVHDEAVWQQVCKGELTGYSIGGRGMRVPLS